MTKKVRPILKSPARKTFFREWRKHRGFTQEDLAEIVGVTPSTVSQIETGKQGFTDSTLWAFASALSCEPADLLIRDPLDTDAPWSIWDNVKKTNPEKRRIIVEAVEAMLKAS